MTSSSLVQVLVIFCMIIANVYSLHDAMTSGTILAGYGGMLDNGGMFYNSQVAQNSVQYQPYFGSGFFG